MTSIKMLVQVGDDYDPTALLREFAATAEQVAPNGWSVELENDLHGLAFVTRTRPDQIVSVTGHTHSVDADGWADWSESGPGETEMSSRLLAPSGGTADGTAFRYEDAWVWDPTAPSLSRRELESLGLLDISEGPLSAAGRGQWAWTAVKLGWKVFGHATRVVTALQLTRAGWNKMQADMVHHRALMARREYERRTIERLVAVRRERLETGTPASRRRARQYYTTLDALIAANS